MDGRAQAPDDRAVRARRGDARAYESLVEEHQAIAFRTAYLITGSAADAEEAAQEAFVRAWLALRRFRRGAEFRPWLLAIVANEARNRVRSRRRRDGLAERVAAEPAWQPPAAEVAATGDGRLRDALARLPERDRSVLACRFVLDLGEQETVGRARHPRRHRQVAHSARARSPARSSGGRGMTLERDLRALADGFPDPPALAPRRDGGRSRRRRRRRRRRRQVALLALALLLLVPATALAVSRRPARPRARVVRAAQRQDHVRHAGCPKPAPTRAACSSARGSRWQQARKDLGACAAGHRRALGTPDGIFEEQLQSGVDITFLYEPRTVAERIGVRKRVLVSVAARRRSRRRSSARRSHPRPRPRASRSTAAPALLLTGHPHLLVIFRRTGDGFDQTYTRLVGTTLLWQRGALLIRIEGEPASGAPAGRDRALALDR